MAGHLTFGMPRPEPVFGAEHPVDTPPSLF